LEGSSGLKFEWDQEKNKANILKHRVSFEDAETVFDDNKAVYLYDDSHSTDEERFHIVGEDRNFRELSVCHCYRGKDSEIIRIISARKASKIEIDFYYGRIDI
jgi:uncharacterized DUF497 family protein